MPSLLCPCSQYYASSHSLRVQSMRNFTTQHTSAPSWKIPPRPPAPPNPFSACTRCPLPTPNSNKLPSYFGLSGNKTKQNQPKHIKLNERGFRSSSRAMRVQVLQKGNGKPTGNVSFRPLPAPPAGRTEDGRRHTRTLQKHKTTIHSM